MKIFLYMKNIKNIHNNENFQNSYNEYRITYHLLLKKMNW